MRKVLWGSLAVIAVIGAGALFWLAIRKPASTTPHPKTSDLIWAYRCKDKVCIKTLISTPEVSANLSSRSVCKLQCGDHGNLWPAPNGQVTLGEKLATIDVKSISASKSGVNPSSNAALKGAFDLFRTRQQSKLTTLSKTYSGNAAVRLQVYFNISKPSGLGFSLELSKSETYELKINSSEKGFIQATITSQNFFGARHALETLDQLIVVDDHHNAIRMPTEVDISDRPSYPYRGILIDTARSFITIDALKRTIDAMGASKLNTLHWHVTDSQSFPFESKSFPELTRLGAYSDKHVYSEESIRELIQYARIRGVRIVPEFDAPAHVGEGWEFAPGTVVCFKAEPWRNLCQEPPCGQLDPTNEQVYEILEGIYSDMIRSFDPVAFHMGGNEVNFQCWNTSQGVQQWFNARGLSNRSTDDSYHQLWNYFQTKSLEKLYVANGGKYIPAIVWTNSLTSAKQGDKYLDPNKYIIQVWTKKDDPVIRELAKKKYKMIFSNYDAMYLDCGYGAWVGTGNNWCSPYISWQKFYENNPRTLLRNLGVTDPESLSLALGGEAAMWTEQVDSSSIDSKIWPRAAAMAERLWSDPASNWESALSRFLEHRERLVSLKVLADSIQPEWCLYNEGQCI